MPSPTQALKYEPIRHDQRNLSISQTSVTASRQIEPRGDAIEMNFVTKAGYTTLTRQRVAKQRSTKHHLLHGWIVEIACCLLLLGAFFAIVATLLAYEHKKLPQWRYGLSLNTLVAVYVIILKASMLLVVSQCLSQLKWLWFRCERRLLDLTTYDEASRGPLGAFKLLWRLHTYDLLTFLGALVTIAALIIDPFAQQVVSSESCTLEVNSTTARLNVANNYIKIYYGGASGSVADIAMQTAINAGIYNPGSAPPFQCDTGNCTFTTPYHTLGFCSTCTNMTSQLVQSVQNVSYTDTDDDGTNFTLTSTNYIYSLPSGRDGVNCSAYLSLGENPILFSMAAASDVVAALTTNGSDILTGLGPGDGIGPVGARCSLEPCIRTCTAVVQNYSIQETIASTIALQVNSLSVNPECLSTVDTSKLAKYGYQPGNDTVWPILSLVTSTANGTYYLTTGESVPELLDMLPRSCLYGISAEAYHSIWAFLYDFLSGNISAPATSNLWNMYGPAPMLAIYNMSAVTFESIDSVFHNISDSITTQIRLDNGLGFYGGGVASEPTLGRTWKASVCVRVRWPFLVYPAVVIIVAIAFFTATIARQRSGDVANWKSSQLALLFHGLHQETLEHINAIGEVSSTQEMEKVAKDISVSLRQAGSRAQLISTKQNSGGS